MEAILATPIKDQGFSDGNNVDLVKMINEAINGDNGSGGDLVKILDDALSEPVDFGKPPELSLIILPEHMLEGLINEQ
jgi:hypothetical protein